MKKMYKMIALILCIATIVMLAGCSISINFGGEDGGKTITIGGGANDGGGQTTEGGKKSGKDRLSQDGVEYLVNNGKLTISGNGMVTKDAIASISHEYNEIDFELGTFDIGDDAFNGYKDIIKVQFRNNVHNIGARAFQGTSLALVCFGTSIESIGDKAFADCCIDYVFIYNENMFTNFNTRYDFGEVAATATNVYVHRDILIGQQDIAGDYIIASGIYDKIARELSGTTTLAEQDYKMGTFVDEKSEFMTVYGGLRVRNWMSATYNPDTNVLDYSFHSQTKDPWEGRDIVYYNTGNAADTPSSGTSTGGDTGNSGGGSSGGSKTGGSSSGGSKPSGGNITTKPATKKNTSCSSCHGSGKKDCGSCNGGYITEYESGQYMGYGSPTREVKKKCMVCQGSGKVKCYH